MGVIGVDEEAGAGRGVDETEGGAGVAVAGIGFGGIAAVIGVGEEAGAGGGADETEEGGTGVAAGGADATADGVGVTAGGAGVAACGADGTAETADGAGVAAGDVDETADGAGVAAGGVDETGRGAAAVVGLGKVVSSCRGKSSTRELGGVDMAMVSVATGVAGSEANKLLATLGMGAPAGVSVAFFAGAWTMFAGFPVAPGAMRVNPYHPAAATARTSATVTQGHVRERTGRRRVPGTGIALNKSGDCPR